MHLRDGSMRAGRVTDVQRFGSRWLRIQMQAGDVVMTEFFGASAVEVVRLVGPEYAAEMAAAILREMPELASAAVLPGVTEAEIPF